MPKWAKRILIGLGAFLGLLLLAIVILPLVIDVDKFRPDIVKIANENINGQLELGKLKLSLWGQIKVEVDGFKVTDAKGQEVAGSKDVYFHVPFSSLFSGSPILTFKTTRPTIRVVKDKQGKLNVMSLMKTKPAAGAAAPETPKEQEAKANLPAIASRASLGVEMIDAQLSYTDELTKLVSEVKDLNVRVKSLSLSRPTDFEVWASLDTRMGKTLTVKGPAKMSGNFAPQFKGAEFEKGTLKMKADLDGLAISMPGMFEKKAGLATNADLSVSVTPKEADVEALTAKFFNVQIDGKGKVTSLDTTPAMAITMKSNSIDLKPWSELLPMLKEYELAGSAGFNADLGGTAEAPQYRANLFMKSLTAKAPNLKAQPRFDGEVKVVTDKVESAVVTMKAPGNDLKIAASVISFTKPKITVNATSTGMDLDQLIEFPPAPAAKPASGQNAASSEGGEGKAKAEPADFDAMLDPMRKNDVLVSAVLNANANLAFIKVKGVKMSNMVAAFTMRDLNMSLDTFKMGVFDGTINASMSAALKPKTPTYHLKAAVAGLELQKAVESQFALFKNTVLGRASFSMEGSGASFNPDPAKKNLNAKGTMKVENAAFTTFDVAKVASEAISKAITDISKKVPGLGNQKIPEIKADTKYEYVSSDFTIAGGKFLAPNFVAKSQPNKGIDINGSTEVGMIDYSLNANWELVDTYNLTKARDISVESNGVRVSPLLADGANPVRLPIKVGGSCFSPQVNYGAVPEALAKVALNNVGKALESKAKAEAQKAIQNEVQKAAPAINKELNKALKGLFGK